MGVTGSHGLAGEGQGRARVAAAGARLVRCRSMSRTPLIVAIATLLAALGLLVGCGAVPTGTASRAPAAASAAPTPVPAVEAPPAGPEVTLKTSKGDVVLALNATKAPVTVANFVKLVKARFYDLLLVHRVEPGFVVQAGDPGTRGMTRSGLLKALSSSPPTVGGGGPGWSIPLERTGLLHDRGVIAMARSQDPDSAGSQFYITLGAAHHLDGGYAVFGAVSEGMDVVDALEVGDRIVSAKVTKD